VETLSRETLDEFWEHPVTGQLIQLIQARLQIEDKSRENCYIAGNPFLTAERHAGLNGGVAELSVVLTALAEKDLELLEIPEEDEVEFSDE